MQEKPAEVNMDQASEYDTESDEEPEEDENVSAQESSQEVGGKSRELNFYGSENTIWTYHKNVI